MAKSINQPSGLPETEASGEECGKVAIVERLHLYLMQAEECMKGVQKLTSRKFNDKQCDYLADKLEVVVQSASLFIEVSRVEHHGCNLLADVTRWVSIFKLLVALSKKIENFIQGCCKDAWIQAAMTLTNVSMYISSIGFQLELCRFAFCKECAAVGTVTLDEVDDMNKTEVKIVENNASIDKAALLPKLISELNTLPTDDKDLATYLLHRLFEVQLKPTSTLGSSWWSGNDDRFILRSLFQWVQPAELLGRGNSGEVRKALWLGTPVAKKTFWGSENPDFMNEAEILAKLCHPNITSMFCCAKDERSCSIIMELMDEDLHQLMCKRWEEKKQSFPFTILEAVDIMLQIGEGVNYLHNKGIVHRDLKSKNILVKSVKVGNSDSTYVHVKVADFALSKLKEKSTFNQTFNTGTFRWMAPEIINLVPGSQGVKQKSSETKKHPFMCDVYSFAMVCYEILTGDVPFQAVTIPRVLKEMVLANQRPNLPDHCSPKLKALITKCWDRTPEERLSFDVICSELKYLKCLLMTGFNEGPHLPIKEPLQAATEDMPLYHLSMKRYFDDLPGAEQLLLMDIVLYYPKHVLWSKPLNRLEWLSMVNGASVDVIESQLKMLENRWFLGSYIYGSNTIIVSPVWHKFCMEVASTLGAFEDRRWVYEVHGRHFRPGGSSLSLRDGGWEKIQRIYLKEGGSSISNVKNLTHCTNVRVLKLVNYHVGEDQVLDLSSLESLRSLEILSCTFSMTENSPAKVLGLGLLKNLVLLKWDNIPTLSPWLEEIGLLTTLQVLELESLENENKLPDVSELSFLRQVTFRFDVGTYSISGLSSKMTHLRYLDLGRCHWLIRCPGVGALVALEELDLSHCSDLRELPNLQELRNLRKLVITGCGLIRELPGLDDLVSLEELRVEGCWRLYLPDWTKRTKLTDLRVFR